MTDEDIASVVERVDPELLKHAQLTLDQVRNFARIQRESMHEFEVETLPGVVLDQKHIPVQSVGAYSPGGLYPLIASAIMTVATPKVAKVPRVVAAAPPEKPAVCTHPNYGQWRRPVRMRFSVSVVFRLWPAWRSG